MRLRPPAFPSPTRVLASSIAAAIALAFFYSSAAHAQDTDHSGYAGDFGLGLVIGDPTGLSAT